MNFEKIKRSAEWLERFLFKVCQTGPRNHDVEDWLQAREEARAVASWFRHDFEEKVDETIALRALAKELWRRLDKNLPSGSNQRYIFAGDTFADLYEWLED